MRFVLNLVLPSLWILSLQDFTIAQTCPLPVLNRLVSHKIMSGETLVTIGQRYRVTPETIMGLNSQARSELPVGETIVIPPFNGIRVNVPSGTLIRDVAQRYKVRGDVLFELNGCQPAPSVLFVPGVVWSTRYDTRPTSPDNVLKFVSPLPSMGKVLTRFSTFWGEDGEVHSGLDLGATIATPVFAVADGTVAFSGLQGNFGNLVVINHAKGYQTRYGQLSQQRVKVGQRVKAGETIGAVGRSGSPSVREPHLHFEVRSNTKLGWVAEDPLPWLGLN